MSALFANPVTVSAPLAANNPKGTSMRLLLAALGLLAMLNGIAEARSLSGWLAQCTAVEIGRAHV